MHQPDPGKSAFIINCRQRAIKNTKSHKHGSRYRRLLNHRANPQFVGAPGLLYRVPSLNQNSPLQTNQIEPEILDSVPPLRLVVLRRKFFYQHYARRIFFIAMKWGNFAILENSQGKIHLPIRPSRYTGPTFQSIDNTRRSRSAFLSFPLVGLVTYRSGL